MAWFNASPKVLQILFRILGALYLISAAFLIFFLPPAATPTYAGHWMMAAIAVACLYVAGVLPRLIAARSHIPDILLAVMIPVRLFTARESLFGDDVRTGAVIGLVVAILIVAYLWSQVRRLRNLPAAA